MICRNCLRRASALRPQSSISRSFSSSSRQFAPDTTASPRTGGTPAATSTGLAQPFSNPLTPSPAELALGASAKSKAKPAQIPVSSCPAGTPLKGLNFLKGRDDPVALSEEEYPEWLWRCLDVKVKEGDEQGGAGDEFCKLFLSIFLKPTLSPTAKPNLLPLAAFLLETQNQRANKLTSTPSKIQKAPPQSCKAPRQNGSQTHRLLRSRSPRPQDPNNTAIHRPPIQRKRHYIWGVGSRSQERRVESCYEERKKGKDQGEQFLEGNVRWIGERRMLCWLLGIRASDGD
jgi:hypothetical protein